MTIFEVLALLVTLTALFSYLNQRFLRLPATIGVMLLALVGALALVALERFGFPIRATAKELVQKIDFNKALLQGMLSFLLFAGGLHIRLADLAEEKWSILLLSTVGVVISTFAFGTVAYYGLAALGLPLNYPWSLLFGALISPTDPIAVLGVLRNARVPKSLETQIAGESLFNDGVGVVLFFVLYEVAVGGQQVSAGRLAFELLREIAGGAMLGLALGWLTYRLLKGVDNYRVEVLLTLALVSGGYALASALYTSGPIAIVCAGLIIGNHGRRFAMSETTRQHLDTFWELIDEILNALLFVLIGFEVLVLTFSTGLLLAGVFAIPALLGARWLSVAIPVALLRGRTRFSRGAVAIMTWGGLRGGISVALALSLPSGAERDTVLEVTYVLVAFSILVQGLTIRRVVAWLAPR